MRQAAQTSPGSVLLSGPPQPAQVWNSSFNLEKAVETADDADDADRQGLEVKRPRNCEVTPKPSMDSVVQPLHLRNRRHLRLNELPVLGSFLLNTSFDRSGFWKS
jgi:hypothetical protein